MSSKFYGSLLPDYADLDNTTGSAPGYRVFISENDGGISLQMIHAKDNPITTSGSAIFMNVHEAKEMTKIEAVLANSLQCKSQP
jgi:uncharacterized protein YbcV (DUF1398 family)